MTTTLDAALSYLSHGLPVFPTCSPADVSYCHSHVEPHGEKDIGKVSLVKWTPYQDRLPTEDEVCTWWRRWPRANIGMATGRPSGLVVIDLDSGAARAEAERRGLEQGPTATTGRVGGLHRYCAYREDAPTVFSKTCGIDFRGQGGYVLLPPSLHRNGPRYTWLVGLDAAILPPLPRWIDELAGEGKRSNGHAGVVLGDIPDHERNRTLLSMGGSMRHRGMSQAAIYAALLVENADRCKPPLADDEVRKIATSVSRYVPGVVVNVVDRATGEVFQQLPPLSRPFGITLDDALGAMP